MIRAVVDTNVWVSALLNPAGHPARVLDAVCRGLFVAILPDVVLNEIRDVLGRPRIQRRLAVTAAEADEFTRLLAERGEFVATRGELLGCRDPKDDALLEAALGSRADVIVTRDDELKRDPDLIARMSASGIAVVSVSAFLRLLHSG